MRPPTPAAPPFGRTPHLDRLLDEAERLVGRLRTAPEADRVRLGGTRDEEATLATLRLDGSPIERVPDLETAPLPAERPAEAEVAHPDAARARGTWLDAMRSLEDLPDEQLQALECVGVRAGLGSNDLVERLSSDPVPTLSELHRRLTLGLVAPDRAGRAREVDQAVHDASVGRILFFATDPADVPGELDRLAAWLSGAARREPALLVSGLLHLELLRIHPFDAANGRLARTAARLALRAGGLDPDGLACPEPALAVDSLGYHEEVASTRRRRDAGVWLERWAEAVVAGLRDSARRLGVLDTAVPERARAFLASLDGDAFTLADYRDHALAPPQEVRAELGSLLDAGHVECVPGARGLRYVRTAPSRTG